MVMYLAVNNNILFSLFKSSYSQSPHNIMVNVLSCRLSHLGSIPSVGTATLGGRK